MFIVTAQSKEELEILKQAKPDVILLADPQFSFRQNAFFTRDELIDEIGDLHRMGILAGINLQKMIEEQETEEAVQALEAYQKAGADEYYIADEGWMQAAKTAGGLEKMVYQPETLVVNGEDACFYTDQGMKAVSLAHELSLDEIRGIAGKCPKCEVLVQGHYAWMSSARKLVTNYLRAIRSPLENKKGKVWLLREATREGLMRVMEDENGTTVFSDEPVSSIRQICDLKDAGIERFRIDTLFEEPACGAKQLQAYRDTLAGQEITPDLIRGSDSFYHMETTVRKQKDQGGKKNG